MVLRHGDVFLFWKFRNQGTIHERSTPSSSPKPDNFYCKVKPRRENLYIQAGPVEIFEKDGPQNQSQEPQKGMFQI